uniref:WH2 domain-containing protein n=1 Tax=Caenorhabditis tropicalis TaxID=1561998 RepID=A0A1I7TCZ0_9PELO
MVDRDVRYSRSPTRNPSIQRSTSFGGAKLHFSYTGNETKTSSRGNSSHLKLPEVSSSHLPRQSSVDYSRYSSSQSSAPFSPEIPKSSTFTPEIPRRTTFTPEIPRRTTFSPEIPRRSTYSSYDRQPNVESISPSIYQPNTSPMIAQRETSLYGDASSARSFIPTSHVPLATPNALLPSSSSHSSTRSLVAPPATTNPHTRIYEKSAFSAYSSYDPNIKVLPADTSPIAPPSFSPPSALVEKQYSRKSPSPTRIRQPTDFVPDPRSRRQTTVIGILAVPSSPFLAGNQPEYRAVSYFPGPPVAQIISGSKPHSVGAQMQNSQTGNSRRNLTIGYSLNQAREIEKAQEIIKASVKVEEAKKRAELEARRRIEEEARRAEQKRIEEAIQLEKLERVREASRLEAERLALEAVMKAHQPPDEDEDVNKFIKNLEERIRDSRDSKNLNGALLAKSAESLTNAPTEVDENVEGRPSNDQVSTQSAADNSELAVLFERLKNMTTDENQNRRKYAENYYDPEDDDSELNSLNSFLSTVTEEDPDMLSVNNHSSTSDLQPSSLQPCVISYIHNMVDGILLSLNKADFANADTHKMPLLYDQDLYSSNADYNYKEISETARQFFTPQSSPVEETKTDFYKDSL